jgi:hypothetical protein
MHGLCIKEKHRDERLIIREKHRDKQGIDTWDKIYPSLIIHAHESRAFKY